MQKPMTYSAQAIAQNTVSSRTTRAVFRVNGAYRSAPNKGPLMDKLLKDSDCEFLGVFVGKDWAVDALAIHIRES